MKKIQKLKQLFRTSGTRHGSYSIGMTVMVIAAVILFNLIVGQIPEGVRNIDVSSTKIYDVSETTVDLLDNLEKEVDMTVLAVKDETDERITNFLSRYGSLSDKINIEWIDPVLHPSALTEYNTTENTIVVACEETGKTTEISFGDILVMDEYSYYYYGSASYSEFDGEGQLTSAVNYVTSDVEKTIYQTSGHGESSLSSTITDLMNKNSYTLSEVNLLMTESIPEDCDLLLMNAPAADLSDDETQMLADYLADGGKMMLLLGETNTTELPNLSEILQKYGMIPAEGYIADPNRSYQGNYYYIFPELSLSEELGSDMSSEMVLLSNTHGMTLTDPERDTISVISFMSSSDQAYAVSEEKQEQGTFTLGAVATETISTEESSEDTDTETSETEDTENKETRLTVISAGSLIDQQITDTFPQLENTRLFMNAVTANFEGVQNLSIEAKSLNVEYNTVQHPGLFSMLMIFGIPVIVLIGGFVIWYRRRKA